MLSLYLNQRTWAHRLPAGAKLLTLCAVSLVLLPVDDARVLVATMTGALAIYPVLGREAVRQLSLIKPLIPILAILMGLHIWLDDWQTGVAAVARLLTMILLANAVTMTTTMSDMMDALEPVLRPLQWTGVDTGKIALAVALVIRFIPVLFAEWRERETAWRARGGGRGTWRLIPGFCLATLRLATSVGDALDARGFGRKP